MSNTLFLTKDEQKVFSALPEALRSEWPVEAESLNSYESPDVLAMRAEISPLRHHPALQKALEALSKGESIDKIALPSLSERDIGEFFFCIGARGISTFLGAQLQSAKTDDDIRAVSHLSEVRHKLLETNASISYA